MIRRITSLIFILTANIILFANAVIPHHHHQDEVCIVNTHCKSDTDPHRHNNQSDHDHDHSHKGGDNSMYCVLDQIEGICPSTIKIGSKSFKPNNNNFATFQIALFNEVFIQGNFLVLKHPHNPTIQSSYTCIISQTKGLRAPPYIS